MTDTTPVPIRRALLSVSDKAGLEPLARTLAERGVTLLSTGGTARALRDAGLDVTDVADVTGSPEILGGRVKTLHPRIHGGILARTDLPDHNTQLEQHDIHPIDLVVVNLYPFEQTVARDGVTEPEAVEQIDIGGPAMIRAAAKNFARVCVLTSPDDYAALKDELRAHNGATSLAFRRRLATAAFARTSAYDRAIHAYLTPPGDTENDMFPVEHNFTGVRAGTLRYGENPHQPAAAYLDPNHTAPSVLRAKQLAGKALSYNNLNDADAALALVRALHDLDPDTPAACVVKHTNPCGAAQAPTTPDAIAAAIAGDPMAAYGGILASGAPIDDDAADAIVEGGSFFEVIIAPAFEGAAVETIGAKWKHCRLLETGALVRTAGSVAVRGITGGLLVQRPDDVVPNPSGWAHAAGPTPSAEQLRVAAAMECVVRALSSNAVCLGGVDGGMGGGVVRLFGAGAGQMDRVASCRLAVEKAGAWAKGSVALSDAFFPFSDGPQILADAGVRVIVHPGGSKRDGDTFELCERLGMTCLTTGVRHFRH